MEQTSTVIMQIIAMSLLILVAWPLCIFALHILHRHWNNIYFVKRKRGITLAIAIQSLLALFVFLPMMIVPCIVHGSYDEAMKPHSPSGWIMTAGIVAAEFCALSTILLVFARIWLYYFDVRAHRELANERWKVLLNDVCHRVGWFTIDNQRRYASQRRILLYVYLFAVCVAAVWFFLSPSPFATLLCMAYKTVVMILSFALWGKYPAFHDQLGIRREIKIFAIMWLGIAALSNGLYAICDPTLKVNVVHNQDLLWASLSFLTSLNLVVAVYIAIIRVYISFIKKQTRSERELGKFLSDASFSNGPRMSEITVKSWKPIIAKMEGYELFINHLIKEFSIENLLFLTEFTQFKAILVELYPSKMNALESEEELSWSLQLPSKLPVSIIACEYRRSVESASVEDKRAETTSQATDSHLLHFDEFTRACSRICAKYINAYSAPMEVNISSLKRSSLQQIYGNDSLLQKMLGDGSDPSKKEELFKTSLLRLQSAAMDIEALMNDSFTRFKSTEIAKEYWMQNVAVN